MSASFGRVVLNFSLAKLDRFMSSQVSISFAVVDKWLAEEAFGNRELFYFQRQDIIFFREDSVFLNKTFLKEDKTL